MATLHDTKNIAATPKTSVCTAIAMFCAMPLAAKFAKITIPTNDKFQVSNSNWSGGLGKTHLAWRIKTHDGKPYGCGAVVAEEYSAMATQNGRSFPKDISNCRVKRSSVILALHRGQTGTRFDGCLGRVPILAGQRRFQDALSIEF